MQNILVCDDDKQIVEAISIYLTGEGYNVLKAYDGFEALKIMEKEPLDLLILDVMMPGLDGIRTTLKIRENSSIPIIILSAKSEDQDKILGLNIGADDYITKPFAVPELIARIRNALRRRDISTDDASDRLTVKNLIMFLSRYEVQVDGETVALTKREYDLLEYLLRNKRTVLTRDQILQEVWGFDYTGETNVVDVYIRYLRAKLDDRFHKKYIYTVRGVGYVVRD